MGMKLLEGPIVIIVCLALFMISFPLFSECAAPALGQSKAAPRERIKAAILEKVTLKNGKTIKWCRKRGCPEYAEQIADKIVSAEKAYGLPEGILAGLAMTESAFNPYAMGKVGERGIVQLHPKSRSSSGVRFVRGTDAYRSRCLKTKDACQQEVLDAGARYLARAISLCGSVELGLGAYNTGKCRKTAYAKRVLRNVP